MPSDKRKESFIPDTGTKNKLMVTREQGGWGAKIKMKGLKNTN